MSNEDFMALVHARARRRFQRGLKRKPMGLIKKLRKAKKEAPANEKPAVVRTHLRDMIIVPEMVGSVIGVYNGKVSSATRGMEGRMQGVAKLEDGLRDWRRGQRGDAAATSA